MRSICLAFLLLAAPAAMAAPPPCRTSPLLKGACYVVEGRLAVGNGTPSWRLWPAGTKRILGVVDGLHSGHSLEDGGLPAAVRRAADRSRDPNHAVRARFDVCPLTRDVPGHMRDVCIAGFAK